MTRRRPICCQVVTRTGDAEWLLCLPVGTAAAGRLYWWSYVYYVSKARALGASQPRPASHSRPVAWQYYELLDTVLRVLKQQQLTFLHVFHHAVVLVMAYAVRLPRARRARTRIRLTPRQRSGWTRFSRCRSSAC